MVMLWNRDRAVEFDKHTFVLAVRLMAFEESKDGWSDGRLS